MIRTILNSNSNFGKTTKRFLTLAGINLIMLAIIIFIFPEILAYAVAALLLMAGIAILGYGLSLKGKHKQQHTQYNETTYYTY